MGTDTTTAATFTNVANWQGVDAEPTAGSQNLVESGGVDAAINNVDFKIGEIYSEDITQNSNLGFRFYGLQGKEMVFSAKNNSSTVIINYFYGQFKNASNQVVGDVLFGVNIYIGETKTTTATIPNGAVILSLAAAGGTLQNVHLEMKEVDNLSDQVEELRSSKEILGTFATITASDSQIVVTGFKPVSNGKYQIYKSVNITIIENQAKAYLLSTTENSYTSFAKAAQGTDIGYLDFYVIEVALWGGLTGIDDRDIIYVSNSYIGMLASAINDEKMKLLTNKLKGKKIAIIGDSISTYAGYCPTGYATVYPSGDVDSVDKCYWKIVADELGLTVNNVSWGGSMVTGMSSGEQDTGFAACGDVRVTAVGRDSFVPDIIFINMGINDFYGETRTLGNWDGNDAIPSDGFVTAFTNAYALMLYKLQNTYKNAKIFCCTIVPAYTSYPPLNTRDESIYNWNVKLRTVINAMGCIPVEMPQCGINPQNNSLFTQDGIHPNAAGMSLMSLIMKNALLNNL